jgi:hypothetical protein
LYFRPTRPQHRIPVLIKPGLTNFSGRTPQANPLALKEKFSAGIFCSFLMTKRKSPSAAASRGKTARQGKRNRLNLTHIDFYKINYPVS